MKKTMTCIVCPNGCQLTIDLETLAVTGNRCNKGEAFAKEEITAPKRCVSSLVKSTLPEYPVVPVRTSGSIPKELIMPLMKVLKTITIDSYLPSGSVVLKNFENSGADIITTVTMKKGGVNV